MDGRSERIRTTVVVVLLLFSLFASELTGEERQVDPTWLHRFVPNVTEVHAGFSSETCHYKPIFGEGDSENRIMRSVVRFGEVTIYRKGKCQPVTYDRQEELYFVLEGKGELRYGDQNYPIRANDFTYLPPAVKHSLENNSERQLRVVMMSFKIPFSISIAAPSPQPKIVNMDQLKEEPVEGHPTSVLYKLLAGPRTGTRDAIDQAYVVTSLFWMDFAPGGTNFPHHHEVAEEVYLVVDGQGEMVAGGGMDGIEGRHPAKAGDAYYFRPNCTVGFYNQNKRGAKAHILAVRSRIPLSKDED
jgi:mannose-6-phosphate isomerase-like protein (cupin superfamily)